MGGVIPLCVYPGYRSYPLVGQITNYLVDFNHLPFYA
nr:MAG TPA: hypothetical protein [Caudoviricetes sp.]